MAKKPSNDREPDLVPQGPKGITHTLPTLIPQRDAKRFLWGDDDAGFVSDWIYGSSPDIHMMSFEMTVGQRFGNSPDFKTYYNCAETYYCLKGEFTFHCPENGEVHVLTAGDLLYFPPNTWHWGYNFGSETCHILESLTPRKVEAVEAYAKKAAPLKEIRTVQAGLKGRFVPGLARTGERCKLVRPGAYLSEIVGETKPIRVDLAVSTDMLTTGFVDLYPGQSSELITHDSDKVLYQLAGRLNVRLPTADPNWWELQPDDAAFIPAGTEHAFFNTSDQRTRFLFSVAPNY